MNLGTSHAGGQAFLQALSRDPRLAFEGGDLSPNTHDHCRDCEQAKLFKPLEALAELQNRLK